MAELAPNSFFLKGNFCLMYLNKQQRQGSEESQKEQEDTCLRLKGFNAKRCSNYHTIVLISHASKVMLKILQARLQQYINFQMYRLDLEKAEELEIKLPTSTGSQKKQGNSRKNIYYYFIDYTKAFVWITTNYGKFLERCKYWTTLPAF